MRTAAPHAVSARARSTRRRAHAPVAARAMVLGEENPQRHTPGFNKQLPPRPLGVASGMPWEPREAERDFAMQSITIAFLETLENFPVLQPLAAAIAGLSAVMHGVRDDDPAPASVPDPPGAWKFAAVGDYGSGTAHEARVAANVAKGRPDLVITAGDNVYPTGRWQDYARAFDPPSMYGALATSVPFMPSLGNHDMYRDDLRPYFAHFPQLQGRPYYAYDMKNAHFVALDGDQDLRAGSAQYRWLEQQLASTTQPWKVVYLHYPLYGRDLNAFPEIREALQPLLAKYHVQLLVCGHEHNYQRSIPIDGVTHILTGGGGQQVYPFETVKPEYTALRKAAFHHVEVSVGASEMVVRAIDENGVVFDTDVIPVGGVTQAKAGVNALVRSRRRPRRLAHA